MRKRFARRVTKGRQYGRPAVLIREGQGGHYAGGRFVPAPTTESPVRLAPYVTSYINDFAEKRDIFPSGTRYSDVLKFLCTESLRVVELSDNPAQGDLIQYQNTKYRCYVAKPYSNGATEYLAVREADIN